MSRPQKKNCAAIVQNRDGDRDIRVARVGSAPLVHLWVHHTGHGGQSIILDFDQAEELVEGINDLLDIFEAEGA